MLKKLEESQSRNATSTIAGGMSTTMYWTDCLRTMNSTINSANNRVTSNNALSITWIGDVDERFEKLRNLAYVSEISQLALPATFVVEKHSTLEIETAEQFVSDLLFSEYFQVSSDTCRGIIKSADLARLLCEVETGTAILLKAFALPEFSLNAWPTKKGTTVVELWKGALHNLYEWTASPSFFVFDGTGCCYSIITRCRHYIGFDVCAGTWKEVHLEQSVPVAVDDSILRLIWTAIKRLCNAGIRKRLELVLDPQNTLYLHKCREAFGQEFLDSMHVGELS